MSFLHLQVQVIRVRGNEPDKLKSLYVLVNNIFLFFGCLDKRLTYITRPPEISSRWKHTNRHSLLYCLRHQNVSCLALIHTLVTFTGLTIGGACISILCYFVVYITLKQKQVGRDLAVKVWFTSAV
jgi:hypothetical protein